MSYGADNNRHISDKFGDPSLNGPMYPADMQVIDTQTHGHAVTQTQATKTYL